MSSLWHHDPAPDMVLFFSLAAIFGLAGALLEYRRTRRS